jgi:RNA polymerase sigma-70 factor (ECF subfamily)
MNTSILYPPGSWAPSASSVAWGGALFPEIPGSWDIPGLRGLREVSGFFGSGGPSPDPLPRVSRTRVVPGGRRMNEAAELMGRIVGRDERALEILYDRFSRALYAAVIVIVKKREDAEEILCEIFQQVWEKAASYDLERGAVYTWLLRMARNRAIDRIRSREYKNRSQDADEVEEMDALAAPSAENALDHIVLSERAGFVKQALGEISPDQRRVLEIAYFEGFSQSQIAERLDLPLGTVKTRMRDGMKALQALLKGRIEWP